jgi:hypothetical protein
MQANSKLIPFQLLSCFRNYQCHLTYYMGNHLIVMCLVNSIEPFAGMVCGLAVYNFTPVDLHFPLALYKKILGHPVNLSDFTELEPVIGQ